MLIVNARSFSCIARQATADARLCVSEPLTGRQREDANTDVQWNSLHELLRSLTAFMFGFIFEICSA